MVDSRRISAVDLKQLVLPHLNAGIMVLTRWRRLSPYGVLAAAAGGKLESLAWSSPATTPLHHLSNVREYVARLLDWLEVFRGVATRYLQHYLAWHRYVDRRSYAVSASLLVGWPL
jgi:hypothetical protein